jgi:hypothetical protein
LNKAQIIIIFYLHRKKSAKRNEIFKLIRFAK